MIKGGYGKKDPPLGLKRSKYTLDPLGLNIWEVLICTLPLKIIGFQNLLVKIDGFSWNHDSHVKRSHIIVNLPITKCYRSVNKYIKIDKISSFVIDFW